MNQTINYSRMAGKPIHEPILFGLAVFASIAQLLDLWTTSRFPLEMEGNIYIRALIDEYGWSDPAAWLAVTAIKLYKVVLILGLYLFSVIRMKSGNFISLIALGFESNVNSTRVSYKQALARLMLGLGKAPKGRWLDFMAVAAPIFCFPIWICGTYHAVWRNYWAVEGRWDLVANESLIWPSLMEWSLIIPLVMLVIMALARKHNNLVARATKIQPR